MRMGMGMRMTRRCETFPPQIHSHSVTHSHSATLSHSAPEWVKKEPQVPYSGIKNHFE
jgi:hypothetical protein